MALQNLQGTITPANVITGRVDQLGRENLERILRGEQRQKDILQIQREGQASALQIALQGAITKRKEAEAFRDREFRAEQATLGREHYSDEQELNRLNAIEAARVANERLVAREGTAHERALGIMQKAYKNKESFQFLQTADQHSLNRMERDHAAAQARLDREFTDAQAKIGRAHASAIIDQQMQNRLIYLTTSLKEIAAKDETLRKQLLMNKVSALSEWLPQIEDLPLNNFDEAQLQGYMSQGLIAKADEDTARLIHEKAQGLGLNVTFDRIYSQDADGSTSVDFGFLSDIREAGDRAAIAKAVNTATETRRGQLNVETVFNVKNQMGGPMTDDNPEGYEEGRDIGYNINKLSQVRNARMDQARANVSAAKQAWANQVGTDAQNQIRAEMARDLTGENPVLTIDGVDKEKAKKLAEWLVNDGIGTQSLTQGMTKEGRAAFEADMQARRTLKEAEIEEDGISLGLQRELDVYADLRKEYGDAAKKVPGMIIPAGYVPVSGLNLDLNQPLSPTGAGAPTAPTAPIAPTTPTTPMVPGGPTAIPQVLQNLTPPPPETPVPLQPPATPVTPAPPPDSLPGDGLLPLPPAVGAPATPTPSALTPVPGQPLPESGYGTVVRTPSPPLASGAPSNVLGPPNRPTGSDIYNQSMQAALGTPSIPAPEPGITNINPSALVPPQGPEVQMQGNIPAEVLSPTPSPPYRAPAPVDGVFEETVIVGGQPMTNRLTFDPQTGTVRVDVVTPDGNVMPDVQQGTVQGNDDGTITVTSQNPDGQPITVRYRLNPDETMSSVGGGREQTLTPVPNPGVGRDEIRGIQRDFRTANIAPSSAAPSSEPPALMSYQPDLSPPMPPDEAQALLNYWQPPAPKPWHQDYRGLDYINAPAPQIVPPPAVSPGPSTPPPAVPAPQPQPTSMSRVEELKHLITAYSQAANSLGVDNDTRAHYSKAVGLLSAELGKLMDMATPPALAPPPALSPGLPSLPPFNPGPEPTFAPPPALSPPGLPSLPPPTYLPLPN